MLTGKRLFAGETVSDTLAAVLLQDVAFDALAAASPSLRRLLARFLDRDPRRRLRDVGEPRVQIEDALAGRDSPGPTPPIHAGTAEPGWPAWSMVAAMLLTAAAAAAVAWYAKPSTPSPRARLSIALPPGDQVT